MKENKKKGGAMGKLSQAKRESGIIVYNGAAHPIPKRRGSHHAKTRRRGYPAPVSEVLDDLQAERHAETFKDLKYGKRGNAPAVKGSRKK